MKATGQCDWCQEKRRDSDGKKPFPKAPNTNYQQDGQDKH